MLGQPEFVHGSDVSVDDAEDDLDPEPLPNHAGAIASELVFVGKIGVAARIELILIDIGNETFGQSCGLLGS